jgi:hypothetical protein
VERKLDAVGEDAGDFHAKEKGLGGRGFAAKTTGPRCRSWRQNLRRYEIRHNSPHCGERRPYVTSAGTDPQSTPAVPRLLRLSLSFVSLEGGTIMCPREQTIYNCLTVA